MISILPCSKCQQLLRMPLEASPQTKLACPKCQAEVTVAELWEDLPAWSVVSATDAESTNSESTGVEASSGSESLAAALADDGELRLQEDEPAKHSTSARKGKSNVDWSQFKPITYEEFERNKRKSGSSLGFVIQVALGGLSAIPIALLILWWGLGKDIGGAGPKVAEYAPWIVPSKFRPVEEGEDDGQDPGAGSEWDEVVEGEDDGFRRFDDMAPPTEVETSNGASLTSGDKDSAPTVATDSAAGALAAQSESSGGAIERSLRSRDRQSIADSGASGSSESGGTSGTSATNDSATSDSATDDNSGPQQSMSIDPPDEESSSAASSSNVFSTIQSAQASLSRWEIKISESDSDAQRELARSLYADLVAVAEQVHAIPEGNPVLRTVRNSLKPLGNEIAAEETVWEVIAQESAYSEKAKDAGASYPLVLIVEVANVEEGNRYWMVESAEKTATADSRRILIPLEMASSVAAGDKFFLLGIVESGQNWESQDGDAPSGPIFEACYLHTL